MVTSSKQIQPKNCLQKWSFWPFWPLGPSFPFILAFWAFISFILAFWGFILFILAFWAFISFILAFSAFISFRFGLLGLHFLSFWPFGPSFPFILAFWAFISFHFGLLGLPSFWPFGLSFLSFWPFSFHVGLLGFHFLSLCFQKASGPDLPPVLKLAFLGPWLPFLSLCDGSPDLRDGQPLPPKSKVRIKWGDVRKGLGRAKCFKTEYV